MNSVQKMAVQRNVARLKRARAKRREEKLANQHMASQEHFAAKERKSHLPDNPKTVIKSPVSHKLCKTCNLKPRANGSTRCAQCSIDFRSNKED